MALDRYGVLVGTLLRHHRDRPDTQGRWFHVNLEVSAGGQTYRGAVDVDSKQSAIGVEWRVVALSGADLGPVAGLPEGYHDLAMTATSGAVDFVRSRWARAAPGCVFAAMPDALARWLLALLGRRVPPWSKGSNLEAASALEPLLAGNPRVLIFGEPFATGLGMHNIHQNQGDPPGSQWWDENGIWQDGLTMVHQSDGTILAFLNKFTSQSYVTDDDGHPA
ncbi:MAG: YukJ family protein [Actinomycetota bacterium]|nr:YukJ family protein [Actinomycetota bacterium]